MLFLLEKFTLVRSNTVHKFIKNIFPCGCGLSAIGHECDLHFSIEGQHDRSARFVKH